MDWYYVVASTGVLQPNGFDSWFDAKIHADNVEGGHVVALTCITEDPNPAPKIASYDPATGQPIYVVFEPAVKVEPTAPTPRTISGYDTATGAPIYADVSADAEIV